MKKIIIIAATLVILCGLIVLWGKRIQTVPMDNDEYYSQVSSVHDKTFLEIWTGKVDEGNNTPLFYSLQKSYQNIIGYQTPAPWLKGQWGYHHPTSQAVLRILPVICMAVGIALIFYYFAMHWHWLLGAYALLVSLSSFMVWTYVCHARPYSLWFLLTVIQIICLLRLIDVKPKEEGRYKLAFTVTNILLALTVIFSVIQTLFACVVLWLWNKRNLRDYVGWLLIPVGIAIFYYTKAPQYTFFFAESFQKLLGASLPIDRIAIILLGIVVLALSHAPILKKWMNPKLKINLNVMKATLLFLSLVYVGCLAILYKFLMEQSKTGEGFQVSNRYFMVLAPIGIFMTAFASYVIVMIPKGVLKQAAWILLLVLLVFRCVKTTWFL